MSDDCKNPLCAENAVNLEVFRWRWDQTLKAYADGADRDELFKFATGHYDRRCPALRAMRPGNPAKLLDSLAALVAGFAADVQAAEGAHHKRWALRQIAQLIENEPEVTAGPAIEA